MIATGPSGLNLTCSSLRVAQSFCPPRDPADRAFQSAGDNSIGLRRKSRYNPVGMSEWFAAACFVSCWSHRRVSPNHASTRHPLGLHVRKRLFGRWVGPRRKSGADFQPQASLPRDSASRELGRRRAFGDCLRTSSARIGGADWEWAEAFRTPDRRGPYLFRAGEASLRLVQRRPPSPRRP